MKVRELRVEVDNPTEQQLRNKRWLAEHPFALAVVLAFIFGLLGLALAAGMSDWPLSKSASAALGALVGIAGGWGISIESREGKPRGAVAILYGLFTVFLIVAFLAIKLA